MAVTFKGGYKTSYVGGGVLSLFKSSLDDSDIHLLPGE